MDLFSHALWGATIIREKKIIWWTLFFGAAPDILSNGPSAIYILFSRGSFWPQNAWQLMPQILKNGYHFWHSIFGALIVLFMILIIKRKYIILIIPYLLHLLLDLFTHNTDYLSRLFYPFVKYNIDRISGLNWWEHSWIWWLNIALLIFTNLIFWIIKKHKKEKRAIG